MRSSADANSGCRAKSLRRFGVAAVAILFLAALTLLYLEKRERRRLLNNLSVARERCTDVENELKDLGNQLSEKEDALRDARARQSDQEARFINLEIRNRQAETEIGRLEDALARSTQLVKTQTAELHTLKTDLVNIRSRRSTEAERILALRGRELSTVKDELGKFQTRCRALRELIPAKIVDGFVLGLAENRQAIALGLQEGDPGLSLGHAWISSGMDGGACEIVCQEVSKRHLIARTPGLLPLPSALVKGRNVVIVQPNE